MRGFTVLFILLSFASVAQAETWKAFFPTPAQRSFFGQDVVAVLNNQVLQISTVSVEKYPISGPLPRTEAEWQDFAVSHVHGGHNFRALRKTLLHTPRTVFVSETSYMEEEDPRVEKLMAVVVDNKIYLFKINDLARNFELNNKKYYKSLFQDLAFGRNDELLKQIVAGSANTAN